MTEKQPEDAPPWPSYVEDNHHPFGSVVVGEQICAYCAAMNSDARYCFSVRSKTGNVQSTQIRPGAHRALLAAGCWPTKFQVIAPDGQCVDPRAITIMHGTAVCHLHLFDEMQKSRYARG